MRHILLTSLLCALALAAGCPQPTHDDDDDNGGDPGPVDILWIVDSSNSMASDQEAMAAAFPAFVDTMVASGPDVGWQLGLTTTQSRPCLHDPTAFAGCADAHGTAGRLRGLDNTGDDVSHPPTILRPTDPDVVPDFQALVDVGIEGATEEYGLWVAALAICASLELPYDSDFVDWDSDTLVECSGNHWDAAHPWAAMCRCLPQQFHDYNGDAGGRFLRDGAPLAVVVLSDEGDYTPMMGQGNWPWDLSPCDLGDPWPTFVQADCGPSPDVVCPVYCKLDLFLEFFASLDRQVVVSVFGPGAELLIDANAGTATIDVQCNSQNSTSSMIGFYVWAAHHTGGDYVKIDDQVEGGLCEPPDLEAAMADLASLVIGLAGGAN